MSKTYPLSPRRLINAGDSGNMLVLGSGHDSDMSVIVLHIVNQGDKGSTPFNGSLIVKARSAVDEAQSNSPAGGSGYTGDDAPFVPVPFRALYLNGASLALPMDIPAETPITDTSIIAIAATGLVVALDALIASGSAIVYRKPGLGSGFPF